jgi:aerobic-type carbon monoxide dehydrogenase small subunit (CoxS/CutS family)
MLCGTTHGCELGEGGAGAVLLDGRPVLSCRGLGVECGGRTALVDANPTPSRAEIRQVPSGNLVRPPRRRISRGLG